MCGVLSRKGLVRRSANVLAEIVEAAERLEILPGLHVPVAGAGHSCQRPRAAHRPRSLSVGLVR